MSDDLKAEMNPAQNPFHFGGGGGLRNEVKFHSEIFQVNPYQENKLPDDEDPEEETGVELSEHQEYVKLMNKIMQNQEKYQILEAMGGVKTSWTPEGDLLIHVQYIEYIENTDTNEADEMEW